MPITPVSGEITSQEINDNLSNLDSRVSNSAKQLRSVLDQFTGTQMIAHKGLMNMAPENTLPAFELAGRYGFKFVECDVSVTSDGALVINHDATVDAMTDGTGTISNMTLAQVQALNVNAGANVTVYEGTKLCTLEDMLKVCIKYNMIPFIEMKNIVDMVRDCDNIYNLVKKYGLTKYSVILSYNKSWLEYVRGLDPEIYLQTFLNPWNPDDVDYCLSLGNCMLGCTRFSATAENIQYCHDRGVKMAISSPTGTGSIDLLSEQQGYTELGVDYIYTGSLF